MRSPRVEFSAARAHLTGLLRKRESGWPMMDAGELIERAALADLYGAAPPAAVSGLRLACFGAGDAWAGLAGALPASAILAPVAGPVPTAPCRK